MYSPPSLTHPSPPLCPLYNYKLRVVVSNLVSDTYHDSLNALAKVLPGTYVFALETGKKTEKLHFHGAFSHSSPRRDTVVLQLKKFLKFDPIIKKLTNSHWSCTLDEEPDTWHRYMCYCVKEQNIICSSFSEKEIEIMYSEFKSEETKIKTAQRSVINTKQRKERVTMDTHTKNIINKIEKENLLKEIEEEEVEVDERFDRYDSDYPPSDFQTRKALTRHSSGAGYKLIAGLFFDECHTDPFTNQRCQAALNYVHAKYFPEEARQIFINNSINYIRSNF